MKMAILAGTTLLLAAHSIAQDCKQFYFLQNNKVVEMTIYNKKGDVTGKNVYNITDVKSSGGETTSTVNSEMFDKKGKSTVKASSNIKCNGGVISIDMKMMLPQQQAEQFKTTDAKAESVDLEYPSNMKVGDQLKDAHFKMNGTSGPINFTLNMDITERKVEGKESVTTTAGTWDCFKITAHTKMNVKMAINIPTNIDTTEWYAPGFGVVKTENKGGGGTAITAIK
jgi:hypothetical protein